MSDLILLIIISFVVIFLTKVIEGKGFGMLTFITVFWSIQIIASYAGTVGTYEWRFGGVTWIYIMLGFFLLGWYFGKSIIYKSSHLIVTKSTVEISDASWKILFVIIALGLIKWGYEIVLNGFRLSDFFDINSLAEMNNSFAVSRYSGGSAENAITQVLNIAVYGSAIIGGFAYNFAKNKRQKRLSIFSLLPAFLITISVNTKATMIGAALLYLTGYFVSYYTLHKRGVSVSIKGILYILVILFAFLAFMIFSMTLRIGQINERTFSIVMRKLVIYMFGNIQTFDVWVSNYANSLDYTNGGMTFFGISSSLGILNRVQGVYTSLMGTSSNVYTAFRGIITDFGMVGGTIALTVIAVFSGASEEYIRLKNGISVISITILSCTFFFMTYGFIISPWTYMSYILAMVLFIAWLIFTKNKSFVFVMDRKVELARIEER